MLIKPVNTLFSGKKNGFVHIISLTKSAVYAILKASDIQNSEANSDAQRIRFRTQPPVRGSAAEGIPAYFSDYDFSYVNFCPEKEI